ncbi:uncharacterized protein [Drosophila tropicalis]|uniref:uncharacterized protein isoform X1 n=2 Tax=Drosophila tropicalis TaxID=46794 RepID=UPI0035ABABED
MDEQKPKRESCEMYSDDDGQQRIRNVLTLEERVEAIRQYDIVPMYSKIAKNFNCSWEQIKSIVSNREPIMELYEATRRHLKRPDAKFEELRRRKLNFLGHCLYEYIQRAQYYLHTDINEELIRTKALEFRDLMGIDNFIPNKPWINHFKAAYNITLSNRQITITRKPPRSLELRDIMSYCGKHTLMAKNLAHKQTEGGTTEVNSDTLHSHASPRPLYRTKTLVATCNQNQATLEEVHQRRKRKISFLEKALYEYIQRSQFHNRGRLDLDNLRTVAISLRDILKIENFFPDKMWFNHFKSHYKFSFSQGVPLTTRRVPLSLDLRDIVSYCGRNEQRVTLAQKAAGDASTPTPTPTPTAAAAFVHIPLVEPKPEPDNDVEEVVDDKPEVENEDDDDDCIAIVEAPELIEIKDDDDDLETKSSPTKRKADVPSSRVATPKIQKFESQSNETHTDIEESGNYSENSRESELPRSVQSYDDALRLLKPLEEFALIEENYRAIGLLTQLEKIFESAANKSINTN